MEPRQYSAYRQTDVITADPKRLVIMCYEEAIRSLHLASLLYSSRSYEAKGRAVQKVLDIIAELREALDFERGGEIASLLDRIYGFMIAHVLRSDTSRNIRGFEQVAAMLRELKSAWEKVFFGQPQEPVLDLGLNPPAEFETAQSAGFLK